MNKRIAFVQTIPLELVGVQLLSSVLKQRGHEVRVFITYIDSFKRLIAKLGEYKPDFLCFSACTADHEALLGVAARLKKEHKVPCIWGGPHATFFPEIIDYEGVDIVVRGEAEHIIGRLIDDPSDTSVPSCHFRKSDGTIVRNEMGRLIDDLDKLPFPDWSLYREAYKSLAYASVTVLAGRGCPFGCSFCYNQSLKRMFAADLATGKYVRLREPQTVVAEIKEYVHRYGAPQYVHFRDDTFIFHRKWLLAFLELYRREIHLPFTCLGRADLLSEEVAGALKDAGIALFFWAVESGSERLRNEVLKKKISNEQVVAAGTLLNRLNIPFRTYNMLAIPTETLDDALSTVAINRQIDNRFPLATVYDPYPGTELGETALQHGWLAKSINSESYATTQYGQANTKCDPRILRVQKLFFPLVRYPRLGKFLRKWIERDHRRINGLVFFLSYGYVFWRTYKYTVGEMIRLVLRTFRPLAMSSKSPHLEPVRRGQACGL